MSNRVVAAVAEEITQEKAGALGRAAAALENALAELKSVEVPADLPQHVREERRARLVAHAARAMLSFVVQREACGLRDHTLALEHYAVPQDVVAQMGKRTPA